jgi:hypothetical protein
MRENKEFQQECVAEYVSRKGSFVRNLFAGLFFPPGKNLAVFEPLTDIFWLRVNYYYLANSQLLEVTEALWEQRRSAF